VSITHPSEEHHVNQAVHLLEFARRPLEHMQRDRSLEEYVEQVKETIHYYETSHPERGALNISSVVQVAASRNSDENFKHKLRSSVAKVCEQMQSDAPSTILTQAYGQKIERILPKLSQERI
jgi:hypothetical protein